MAFENCYAEVLSTSHVEGYYDESNDSYLRVLESLLPPGAAWVVEAGSEMAGLLEGLSYSFLRVANRAQDLLTEFDPRTTFELLEDWERVLDLPGDNPTPATTLADRREAVHGLLLGFGDPTTAFFEELALGAGYTVVVRDKEYDPFVPGSPVGDPLTNGEWAFFWWVVTTSGTSDDSLEWLIDRVVPAHTGVSYIFYGVCTERTNPKNFGFRGVAHDQVDTGLWVAVGLADGVDAYLATSPYGENWTEQTNPKNVGLEDVAYNGAGLWVAVGYADGADAYIISSPDGEAWTERANPKNFSLYAVAHNGSNLWAAMGVTDGADSYAVTSPDGIVWTERAPTVNVTMRGIAHDQSAMWVAVGHSDGVDATILTSADGTTWVERAPTVQKNINLYAVAYGGGLWVAVGGADGTDGYILTSPDGLVWTEQENPKDFNLYGVAYDDTAGIWVACGAPDGTDTYMITSHDGETWVDQTNPKNFSIRALAHNGASRFVFVGDADGADAYMLTSV